MNTHATHAKQFATILGASFGQHADFLKVTESHNKTHLA